MDIEKISKITTEADIPFLVDNTIPTPYLCNPFDYGANLVMHSMTKFIGGHGIAIGGVIIDSGSFDWNKTSKFTNLTKPYLGYHNLNFYNEFGPGAFLSRARAEGLERFWSSIISPKCFLYNARSRNYRTTYDEACFKC